MVYLDHAASTPIYPEVREAMEQLFHKDLGNPSAIHICGREAKALIDEARYLCAKAFRTELDGVIFTSGATEAAHLSIIGSYLVGNKRKKILVSPLVHKCIWSAITFLEKHFDAEYDLLPITKEGFIDLSKLEDVSWSDYSLVICEHGNSELGHVQPVVKLGRQIENLETQKPLLIVDTAASIVSETISLEHLKCDILFFSGEKFGGPAGVGAVVKKEGVTLTPILGGSHEFGNRGGTENILGIVGMCEALKQRTNRREKLRETWKLWHGEVRKTLEKAGMKVITPERDFLPHVMHFIHSEMKADLFVQKADLEGVCLSAGSACSSGTVTGSQALQNLGYSEEESKCGVRISWGWNTTKEDLEMFSKYVKS